MKYKLTALILLSTLAGAFVFAGCATTENEGKAQASPERSVPGHTGSGSAANEFQLMSARTQQWVKGLEYSDKTAEDFAQMVRGWKNRRGESVLISWSHRLSQARQDYQQGRISNARLAGIERDVVKDLPCIQQEVSYVHSEKNFELDAIIRSKQAQCLGYSQLVFIAGNSVGLPVQAISVFEGRFGPLGDSHVACLVNLSDGRTMMVDLAGAGVAGAGSFVSEPFMINEQFRKVGNYLELKYEGNPLRIHRRIQVLDRAGLVSAIYSNRGVVFERLHQYTQAVSNCNKAIELNPQNAEAYDNRGIAFARSGMFTQAISDFNEAIGLNPKLANAYNNRANAYGNLGQHAQAVSDCSKAIDLDPHLAEAYLNRGLGYLFLGKPEKAKMDLSNAVDLKPALKQRVEQIANRFKLQL